MIGILTEQDRIFFNTYDELSYTKKGSMVELYVNDFCIGYMEVWGDSEMNGREYLTINDEIIYLDTITNNNKSIN
jgi:hypothetical protein